MPHLNPSGVDLVNAAFIVNQYQFNPKVLLIDHKKLGGWYAPGGHVEPNENSDESIIREVKEETGLEIGVNAKFIQSTPVNYRQFDYLQRIDPTKNNNSRALRLPWLMDIHDFPGIPGHRHMALIYLVVAMTDDVQLETAAHREIRWFSVDDLVNRVANFNDTIRWYALQAIKEVHGTDIPEV